jgi:hypothetical protein
MLAAAVAVLAAVFAAGAVVGFLLRGLFIPEGPPVPPAAIASPAPAVTSSSSASTQATNKTRITVPITLLDRQTQPRTAETRISGPSQRPTAQEPAGSTNTGAPVRLDPPEYGQIVIELEQTAGASAIATSSVDHSGGVTEKVSGHARLGVIAGTVPGVLALDFQVARLEVPPWVVGVPLEIGMDVEGNPQQIGAGLSVGGKAFAAGGGYMSTTGPGWFLGLGLRF